MTESTQSNVVLTDLPSNENYITGQVAAGDITRTSTRRRFTLTADGFTALAPIPDRFGTPELRNGIIGFLATNDVSTNGIQYPAQGVHLVAHGPGTVPSHLHGWNTFGWQHSIYSWGGNTPPALPAVALAGQTTGTTVVGLGVTPSSQYAGPSLHVFALTAADDVRHLVINLPHYNGTGMHALPPLSADRIFISAGANPFVWSYEGWTSRGNEIEFTGLRLNDLTEADVGANSVSAARVGDIIEEQYTRSGNTGAFRHRLARPNERMPAPCFVKPWSTDNVGAPEVWLFLPEDNADAPTGRWEIYRSRWRPGQRQRITYADSYIQESEFLADDDAYNAGRSQYPRRNRYGYAFEHDWHNSAHHVATVGPFPTVAGADPVPQFRIERDRKRRGLLHLVYGQFTSYQPTPVEIWFCSSRNDGRTWSSPSAALHQSTGGGF